MIELFMKPFSSVKCLQPEIISHRPPFSGRKALLAIGELRTENWELRTGFLRFLRQQWLTLNIPGKMVDGVAGGQDSGAAGSKGEPDQALTGDFEGGLRIRCQLDDAALAAQGGGGVEIAVHVEGQALRTSQATIEDSHCAVRVNPIDGIKARGSRSGHEQFTRSAESHVVGGDAGLQGGKNKNLPVAANFENGAAAVAHV